MARFVTAISQAGDLKTMAEELGRGVEADLSASPAVAGVMVLATAAVGPGILEIGDALADRWPGATVLGTSFEGVMAEGCLYRDQPAVVVLAWTGGSLDGPIPLVLEPEDVEPDRMAAAIGDRTGRDVFRPGDLVVLFPDAHHSPGLEAAMDELGSKLAPACVAGSASCGLDGYEATTFVNGESLRGGLIGLFVPADAREGPGRVEMAGASRSASPWLEITKCRSRWIDELEGEPALDWVRRQLGLDAQASIEPYLDRLLARVRKRGAYEAEARDDSGQTAASECLGGHEYDERYVIGLDARRGSFSWPGPFASGDELALALPDASRARERLQAAVEGLPTSSVLFQFACRARDETLHGDPGLEAAWLAHCARDRQVIGTIAPFQLAMGHGGGSCRILVHSTVLAALGRP